MATKKKQKLSALIDVSQFSNRQGSYSLRVTERHSDGNIDIVMQSLEGREYGGIIGRQEAARLLTLLAGYLANYSGE